MSRLSRTIRKVIGTDSALERQARSVRNLVKYRMGKTISRRDLFISPKGSGQPLGVLLMGGCDVTAAIGAGPRLARNPTRPFCMAWIGTAPESRSDLLVQTLSPPDPALTRDVRDRLDLVPDYFDPRPFMKQLKPPHQAGIAPFPVEAVVLSISVDTSRTMYRHREHGFLVDPGGWWLSGDMGEVIADKSAMMWFAKNFEKIGRIDLEDSMKNFERIIGEIRKASGAHVIVMNVLSVDPGTGSLDYKFANSPNKIRRREFNIALNELSQTLDFPVLDVDRIAKGCGIAGQADFVHYTQEQKRMIASEFTAMLAEAGLVEPVRRSRSR